MFSRMLVVVDASPDTPDDSSHHTIQLATTFGATVYVLHLPRGHLIPQDISAGAKAGVPTVEDDTNGRERQVVQAAVDQIAAAGIEVHGEMIEVTEHDAADVVIQRATELDVELIVMSHQHHRGSALAERVIHQKPHCSILLAQPLQQELHRH
jgi:nucleotide-binding universal stress UspA family protein